MFNELIYSLRWLYNAISIGSISIVANRKLGAIVVLAMLSCSCLKSHLVHHDYQLKKLDDRYFVLPPDNSAIRVWAPQKEARHSPLSIANCSIRGSGFSSHPSASKTSGWIIGVPAPEGWWQRVERPDIPTEWTEYLEKLDALRANRCLTFGDYSSLKQGAANRLAAPVEEALYFYYSFGRGGAIDLVDGMRLHFQRSVPSTEQEDATREISYDVVKINDEGLGLSRVQTGTQPASVASDTLKFPETTLSSKLPPAPLLRLFLQNVLVSGDVESPAVLVGASNVEGLNAASDAIQNRSKTPCLTVNQLKMNCLVFDGAVTASAEIKIYINGRKTFVPLGTSVGSLLSNTFGGRQSEVVQSTKIERLFDSEYLKVNFDDDTQAVKQLSLVAGDKVSWDRSPAKLKK